MLVLKALARGPRHGYAIAEWIQEASGDVLRVEEGALYPALHRLELKGLLSAEWGASDNNRRAKYYALTTAGRKQLAAEAAQWRRLSGAVAQVMLATSRVQCCERLSMRSACDSGRSSTAAASTATWKTSSPFISRCAPRSTARAGLGVDDAQAAAQRRFGNVLSLKEACRELWTLNAVERLGQDLRFGARMLRRSPGFTAVALATLTLGVGSTTAILAFLDLRPLPVPRPEELVLLHWTTQKPSSHDAVTTISGCEDLHIAPFDDCSVPYPIYHGVSTHARSFAGTAAFSRPYALHASGDETRLADIQFTTGNYFSVLGVGAALGRTLLPADDEGPGELVAVLGHRYWRDRFNADPGVVGRAVIVNGTVLTVVGVLPQGFFGLDATQVPAMGSLVCHSTDRFHATAPATVAAVSETIPVCWAPIETETGVTLEEAGTDLPGILNTMLDDGQVYPFKRERRPGVRSRAHAMASTRCARSMAGRFACCAVSSFSSSWWPGPTSPTCFWRGPPCAAGRSRCVSR